MNVTKMMHPYDICIFNTNKKECYSKAVFLPQNLQHHMPENQGDTPLTFVYIIKETLIRKNVNHLIL